MQYQWAVRAICLFSALTCVLSAAILPSESPTTERSKSSLDSDFPTIHQDPPSKSSDGVSLKIDEDRLPFILKESPPKSSDNALSTTPVAPSDDTLPLGYDPPSTSSNLDNEFPNGSSMKDTDPFEGEGDPSHLDSDDFPWAFSHSPMEDPDVFEGDLAIPQEMIDEYYDEEEEPTDDGSRKRRAAVRGNNILWTNGIVPFAFSNTTDLETKLLIAKAIAEIEQETCLRFILSDNEEDYIEFSGEGSGCSSHVGKKGGKQIITLPRFRYGSCRTHGIIIHEICHALGMWHEQSRPDRDQYIEILEENIQTGKQHNFRRRSSFQIDYRGEGYDFGSIMHYSLGSFSKNGQPTLKVVNATEYDRQGQPKIGQRAGLSKSDIIQLNRMYNCQGSGVKGTLEVFIESASNVLGSSSYADRYVKVSAVDDRGVKDTKITRYLQGEDDLAWKQWVDFGRKSWQYIEISLWDDKFLGPTAEHDRLTEAQTFSVNPGYHTNLRHCNDRNCSIATYFNYNLMTDGEQTHCHPNPCYHGGICWQLSSSSSYECSCPMSYSGPRCEYINGDLVVYAYRGFRLLNSDGPNNRSDPYLYLVAYDNEGKSKHIRSKSVTNSNYPTWNQWLHFGYGHWKKFVVSIFDEDEREDDRLSDESVYELPSYYTTRTFMKKDGYGDGAVYFNYHFRP